MLSKEIVEALNRQVNAELHSAYIYYAMMAYFDQKNLTGASAWMKAQVQEELFHANKFFAYISERQGKVVLEAIEKPAVEWKSILDVFEAAYKHEVYISSRINDLVKLARDENDNATYNFLQWYVSEQVEEEANVDAVIQKLKLVGDNGHGILMIDQQLGTRVFVMPTTTTA